MNIYFNPIKDIDIRNVNGGSNTDSFTVYRAQVGDDVNSVCEKFGVSSDQILKFNRVSEFENIKKDSILVIPKCAS